MRRRLFFILMTIIGMGILFEYPLTMYAQETNEVGYSLEEITVTALRQETKLSETPIAATAMSGDELASLGINRTDQLAATIPNLRFDLYGSRLNVAIRGVSSPDNTEKGDPSSSMMVDGVYYARAEMQIMSFLDVERVEVLRGPQGTLYGRNATAGVINFISKRPQMGSFSTTANASYGTFNATQLNAAVNVPIGERFALRAAVGYDRRDSYLEITSPDTFSIDPAVDNFAVRVSGLAAITDKLQVLIRTDYGTTKGIPMNSVPSDNFFDFTVEGDPRYLSGRSSEDYRSSPGPIIKEPENDNKTYGILADVTLDTSIGQVNYLGSYRNYKKRQYIENEMGTPMANTNTEIADFWQNSQELRLVFDKGKRFSGQAGAYFFHEESSIMSGMPDANFVAGRGGIMFDQDPSINENIGLYGQTVYKISDEFNLTTGLRYSQDEKSRKGYTYLIFGDDRWNRDTWMPSEENNAKTKSNKITWRVGLDYNIPDLGMLYGSVATGYKAGSFNNGCVQGEGEFCNLTEDMLYYDPETLMAYEAGTKFYFMDKQIYLDLSAFYYDYKDMQRDNSVDWNNDGDYEDLGEFSTGNASSATVFGVETSVDYLLGIADELKVTLNYLKAEYNKYTPAPGVDRSGFAFDYTPEWTGSVGYTHTWTIAESTLKFNVKFNYSDAYKFTADLTSDNPRFLVQPSFYKTDLTLSYVSAKQNWTAEVFANNLEDEITLTSASTGFMGMPGTARFQDPRTYGLRISYRY